MNMIRDSFARILQKHSHVKFFSFKCWIYLNKK